MTEIIIGNVIRLLLWNQHLKNWRSNPPFPSRWGWQSGEENNYTFYVIFPRKVLSLQRDNH